MNPFGENTHGAVKFSKEFITPIGLKEWVTLEWPVDEPFDEKKAMETFTKVKDFVCNYQSSIPVSLDNSIPPPYGPPPIITVERSSEDTRIAELIRDIYACTELDGGNGLLTFNKLASTCKEAQQAFDIMFRKLSGNSNDTF
jgi:hypothetical protein